MPDRSRAASEGTLAFVTDLRALAFDEGEGDEGAATIEICRDGRWSHPHYGEIVIDAPLRASFERNFRLNVRRTGELPLDYDHEPGPAPGWITSLFSHAGSLFARVRLTPEGRRRVLAREYRFFSPEWHPDWVDPESEHRHGPTLFGGALTNRPFFRGMQAICCADSFPPDAGGAAGCATPAGDSIMNDGTEAEPLTAPRRPDDEPAGEVRRMRERVAALEEENAVFRAREERAALLRSFGEARWGERGQALAPRSLQALVESLLKAPAELRDEVAAALRGLQFVELAETGWSPPLDESDLSASEESLVPGVARSLGLSLDEARRRFAEVKQQRDRRRRLAESEVR